MGNRNMKNSVRLKLTAVSISRRGKQFTCFMNLPYDENDKATIQKQTLDDLATKHLNCPDGGTYSYG